MKIAVSSSATGLIYNIVVRLEWEDPEVTLKPPVKAYIEVLILYQY